jgi:glycosyltransferase involved in cell wall biosynthesis
MAPVVPHHPGEREISLVILYDQPIDVHFPAHYRDVYLGLLSGRGVGTCLVAGAQSLNSDAAVEASARGAVVYRRRARKSLFSILHRELTVLSRLTARAVRDKRVRRTDVVLVHDDPVQALIALMFCRAFGRGFVYRISHLKPETVQLSGGAIRFGVASLAARLRNWLLRRADAVVSMSAAMASYLVDVAKVQRARVTVVASCIDTDHAPPCEASPEIVRQLAAKACRRWAVYAGIINDVRGLEFLLDVAASDVLLREDFGLVVAGVSHDRSAVHQYGVSVVLRGLDDRVIVLSHLSEAELGYVLSQCDVGLSPYPENAVFQCNSPVKSLEYLWAGLPVVGTAVDDQVCVIQSTGAGRIVARRANQFARAIVDVSRGRPSVDWLEVRAWIRTHRSLGSAADALVAAVRDAAAVAGARAR